jgi:glycosyltransferase involved in cell wall biosynthesis
MGKWARYIGLHKLLSRKALVTVTTNETLNEQVKSWGAKAFILEDKLPDIPLFETKIKSKRFSLCVINSYLPDEPLEEIWKAAKMLSEYDFYVTGKISRAPNKLVSRKPDNVILTDFLPDEKYFKLLNKCDAIMVLTKRDLTMLCGAYEAVAVEKPLITSDWPVLKNYFNKGTLFVDNTPESIVKAIKEVRLNQAKFNQEIKELKERIIPLWEKKFAEFIKFIYCSFKKS